MAHTFDIRFARSGGLAAFLEAPANTFRWKGAGRLSIDGEGISIAVRRGLLWLFPRARRVPAADLREVSREGEALRVEFATKESPRAVVPFWVRDQGTAREIVRLLPTSRTVEMEHDTTDIVRPRFRIDWRALSLVAAALILIAGGIVVLQPSDVSPPAIPATEPPAASATERTPVAPAAPPSRDNRRGTSSPSAAVGPMARTPDINVRYPGARRAESVKDATHPSAGVATPTPATERQLENFSGTDRRAVERSFRAAAHAQMVEGIVPILPGMPAYEAARRELDLFKYEAALARSTGTDGWWRITVRIHNTPGFNQIDLSALRDMELAVAMAWRHYLYVADDPSTAPVMREFAERLEERLELYVR